MSSDNELEIVKFNEADLIRKKSSSKRTNSIKSSTITNNISIITCSSLQFYTC